MRKQNTGNRRGLYKPILTDVLVGVVALAAFATILIPQFTDRSKPQRNLEKPFSTSFARQPYEIVQDMNHYHGGVYAVGNDRDFDGDGELDSYIIANDGARYATHSSEDKHPEGVGTMWHYHGTEKIGEREEKRKEAVELLKKGPR